MDYKDKNWLQHQYIKQGLTCKQIADICECHERTIHQGLVRFGIPRRHTGWRWENLRLWREKNPDWKKHSRKKRRNVTEEYKRRRSGQYRGAGNPNWKGGLTALIRGIRRSPEYYQWRKAVLIKYNYVCQQCGSQERPQAHHKLCIVDYPNKTFDIENGTVLCEDCHRKLNFTTNGRCRN